MPPIPQEHLHIHRKKMIATAFVLVLILGLVALLAFIARNNQRNAVFETWYQREQSRIAQENLNNFASTIEQNPQVSRAEASSQAQANLKAFVDSFSGESSTSTTSVNTRESKELLRTFGRELQKEKDSLRAWYFETHNQ